MIPKETQAKLEEFNRHVYHFEDDRALDLASGIIQELTKHITLLEKRLGVAEKALEKSRDCICESLCSNRREHMGACDMSSEALREIEEMRE